MSNVLKRTATRFLHWLSRPVSRWEWIAVIVFGLFLIGGGEWWGLYFVVCGIILFWRKA